MLRERVVSAVVMLVVFVVVNFFLPDSIFRICLALLAGVAGWEWSRLAGVRNTTHQLSAGVSLGFLAVLVLWFLPHPQLAAPLSLIGLLFWLMVVLVFVLNPTRRPVQEKPDYIAMILGAVLLLICVFFMELLHNRSLGGSSWLLVYVLSVVWVMDIGAYFSGKRFGKRKLAPLISPGKTQEGVFGGLACSIVLIVLALIVSEFVREHLLAFAIGTLLAAVTSVVGDLFESRLKRAADMKDSSQLIKGHGGVLDRIDGVIAAVPAFAFAWIWL